MGLQQPPLTRSAELTAEALLAKEGKQKTRVRVCQIHGEEGRNAGVSAEARELQSCDWLPEAGRCGD